MGRQQVGWVDAETGECSERRLKDRAEAEHFYRELQGKQVRVGIEVTRHSRWFERLLAELNIEIYRGSGEDSSQAGAKQKTDRWDRLHILKLMMKDDFLRIWAASPENRDLRQLDGTGIAWSN